MGSYRVPRFESPRFESRFREFNSIGISWLQGLNFRLYRGITKFPSQLWQRPRCPNWKESRPPGLCHLFLSICMISNCAFVGKKVCLSCLSYSLLDILGHSVSGAFWLSFFQWQWSLISAQVTSLIPGLYSDPLKRLGNSVKVRCWSHWTDSCAELRGNISEGRVASPSPRPRTCQLNFQPFKKDLPALMDFHRDRKPKFETGICNDLHGFCQFATDLCWLSHPVNRLARLSEALGQHFFRCELKSKDEKVKYVATETQGKVESLALQNIVIKDAMRIPIWSWHYESFTRNDWHWAVDSGTDFAVFKVLRR